MPLKRLLAEHKAAICKAWLEQSLAIYSDEYAKFAQTSGDPFANPVGAIFREGLASVFDVLLDEADVERCRPALTPVVRVQAVQDASPSQALAFVPLLKSAVRESLADKLQDAESQEALSALDTRIDRLTLVAFDLYTECREKIAELRVNEAKRSMARALVSRRQTCPTRPTPSEGKRP
ncbi:RsbRD N-terminal domain-containing protein [Candidatus Sumerlaeota bacterium]|nr:RsbRD N-terminal domain-containing protein [Candidatus Sumerlaeota bacterium]